MTARLVSQGFLGSASDEIFRATTAGIVGLGGGGSHVGQQLAHVGVGGFVLADFDTIEEKNRNRLVGGTAEDVRSGQLKVDIGERLIRGINPVAQVKKCPVPWQEALEDLRGCSIIFGCVDKFGERAELERFARRHLIPYIDLGMDVHSLSAGYSIGGQVVLSSPGGPCLWCLGIITEERLAREAAAYGAAGSRPQVVWPNGVLASIGVGLAIQLLSPWHPNPRLSACCEYDGNNHRVETSRFDHMTGTSCGHYPPTDLGDAFYQTSSS